MGVKHTLGAGWWVAGKFSFRMRMGIFNSTRWNLSNGNRKEELKALRSDTVEIISENQKGQNISVALHKPKEATELRRKLKDEHVATES